ncbi:hypothetical protein H8D85_01910 [bacterium]|nr:hypothetical protein [bacterium]
MDIILVGILVGCMTVFGFIMLIEKSGPVIKKLLIGHYLFTDIIGTMIAYTFLPVVGLVTLISAGTFCILFTLYLQYRRATTEHMTISQLIRRK